MKCNYNWITFCRFYAFASGIYTQNSAPPLECQLTSCAEISIYMLCFLCFFLLGGAK